MHARTIGVWLIAALGWAIQVNGAAVSGDGDLPIKTFRFGPAKSEQVTMTSLAFSSDDSVVAAMGRFETGATKGGWAQSWNVDTSKEVFSRATHGGWMDTHGICVDGPVAIGLTDGSGKPGVPETTLIDVTSGTELGRWRSPSRESLGGILRHGRMNDQGGTPGPLICMRSMGQRASLVALCGSRFSESTMRHGPNGKPAAPESERIALFCPLTGKVERIIEPKPGDGGRAAAAAVTLRWLELSPGGTRVAALDNEQRVLTWEVATGKQLACLKLPFGEQPEAPNPLAPTSMGGGLRMQWVNEDLIIIGSGLLVDVSGGRLETIDWPAADEGEPKEVRPGQAPPGRPVPQKGRALDASPDSVAVSPDGRIALSVAASPSGPKGREATLTLMSVPDRKIIGTIASPGWLPCFSHDSKRVAFVNGAEVRVVATSDLEIAAHAVGTGASSKSDDTPNDPPKKHKRRAKPPKG